MNTADLIEQFRLGVEHSERMPEHLVLPRWTPQHWAELATICQPMRVVAGEAIITSGNTERALYLVVEGSSYAKV